MDWKWVKISNRLFTTSVAMVTYVNIHKKQQQTNKQKSNTIWSLSICITISNTIKEHMCYNPDFLSQLVCNTYSSLWFC
jgi:hypothetical protein